MHRPIYKVSQLNIYDVSSTPLSQSGTFFVIVVVAGSTLSTPQDGLTHPFTVISMSSENKTTLHLRMFYFFRCKTKKVFTNVMVSKHLRPLVHKRFSLGLLKPLRPTVLQIHFDTIEDVHFY